MHDVIGSARDEKRIRIFSQLDPYVQRTQEKITALLKGIFKVPQTLESLV
jgi:hypothetical protein